MVSLLMGTGEHLCRTENLLHCLGSVTSYCCTDKKGILSWPNTSPEKIFFLQQAETDHGEFDEVEDGSSKKEVVILPETLTANHNIHDPFRVDFDDTNWEQHLESLRPLGLAGLLNTCSLANLDSGYSHLYSALQVFVNLIVILRYSAVRPMRSRFSRFCIDLNAYSPFTTSLKQVLPAAVCVSLAGWLGSMRNGSYNQSRFATHIYMHTFLYKFYDVW